MDSRVRVLVKIAAALAGIAVAALLGVYLLSARELGRVYAHPEARITVPSDTASIARGEHLVQAIAACATCHDVDLGGKVYADMGPVGVVAGRNLTRGNGGVGETFTDDDWVRAIRFGIRPDGTSLIMMPSEVYANLSDADLGAAIAYLKQVPPVDRDIPPSRFGLLGRTLIATGKLKILSAPKTHGQATVASVPEERSPAYGRYLAEVSGCAGCHGPGLSGGPIAGPPGLPPAANLTPSSRLAQWSESDFRGVLREGRKPDGMRLDEFMPWRSYAGMTDLEIGALWDYLRSVPPRPFGNR